MAADVTIRVLVPLDQLAEVLGLVATEVPLGEEAKVKVQDPSHEPGRFRLPVRGLEKPRYASRAPIVRGTLLGVAIGLAGTLASPALRGLPLVSLVVIVVATTLIGGAVAAASSQRGDEADQLLGFDEPERLRIVRLRRVHDHDEVIRRLRAAGFVVLEHHDPSRRDLDV